MYNNTYFRLINSMKLGKIKWFVSFVFFLYNVYGIKLSIPETLDSTEAKQLEDVIKDAVPPPKESNSDYISNSNNFGKSTTQDNNGKYYVDLDNKENNTLSNIESVNHYSDNSQYSVDLDDEDLNIINGLIGDENMKYLVDLDNQEKSTIKNLTTNIKQVKQKETLIQKPTQKPIQQSMPSQNPSQKKPDETRPQSQSQFITQPSPVQNENINKENVINNSNPWIQSPKDYPKQDFIINPPGPVNINIPQHNTAINIPQQTAPINYSSTPTKNEKTNAITKTVTTSPGGGTVTTTNINIRIGNQKKEDCNTFKPSTSVNQELLSQISNKLDLLINNKNTNEQNLRKESPQNNKIIDKLLAIIKQKIN